MRSAHLKYLNEVKENEDDKVIVPTIYGIETYVL